MNVINKQKNLNIEMLRLISTISVILLHVNFQYFMNHMHNPDNNYVYIVESIINIITRFSVPCFVMISGALLLEKDENTLFFFKKTFRKIYIPAIIVGMGYFVVALVSSGYDWVFTIKKALSGNFYNLWYLYMLAGLYLITPLISIIKNSPPDIPIM